MARTKKEDSLLRVTAVSGTAGLGTSVLASPKYMIPLCRQAYGGWCAKKIATREKDEKRGGLSEKNHFGAIQTQNALNTPTCRV